MKLTQDELRYRELTAKHFGDGLTAGDETELSAVEARLDEADAVWVSKMGNSKGILHNLLIDLRRDWRTGCAEMEAIRDGHRMEGDNFMVFASYVIGMPIVVVVTLYSAFVDRVRKETTEA